MQLKLFVLSAAALALWLTPLVALDKKVGWHKFIQGASLCVAVGYHSVSVEEPQT